MFIRAYLRASTAQQDALRGREELIKFADKQGYKIAGFYVENASGASIDRPEIWRLLADSSKGDIILIEKMDRLTRLPYEQWKNLETEFQNREIKIVVLDQPTTHRVFSECEAESSIGKVLSEFMLNLAAAMAHDEYETRKKRQAQGIKKAKENNVYLGRKPDKKKWSIISSMLKDGKSWSNIIEDADCSRATVAKVSKMVKEGTL